MSTFNYIGEKQSCEEQVRNAADEKRLEEIRIEYLGRKGKISAMYANLAGLSQDEKPEEGKRINNFRTEVTRLIDDKKSEIRSKKKKASHRKLDVTIPGVAPEIGHLHVLTRTIEEICSIFERLGYTLHEGPE